MAKQGHALLATHWLDALDGGFGRFKRSRVVPGSGKVVTSVSQGRCDSNSGRKHPRAADGALFADYSVEWVNIAPLQGRKQQLGLVYGLI